MSMFHELMMRKKEEIMYATIKGTLTENDGVFSGFSASNYLQLQQNLDTSKPFEIVVKFTTDTLSLNNSILYESSYGFFIRMKYSSGRKIYIDLSHSTDRDVADNVGGQIALQNDTTYWLKFSFDLSKYVVSLSTDGINYTEDIVVNSTLTLKNSGHIDIGSREGTNTYVQGSIDLNRSYIKIDDTKYKLQAVVGYTIVGSPTITDGVVSGATVGNYVQLPSYEVYDQNSFEFVANVTLGSRSDIQNGTIIRFPCICKSVSTNSYAGLYGELNRHIITFNIGYDANNSMVYKSYSDTVFENQNVFVKWEKVNGIISCFYSIDNKQTWIEVGNDGGANNTKSNLNNNIIFGNDNWSGITFNMNETYIKINNKLWFNGQQA